MTLKKEYEILWDVYKSMKERNGNLILTGLSLDLKFLNTRGDECFSKKIICILRDILK